MGIKDFFKNLFKRKQSEVEEEIGSATDQSIEIENVDGDVNAENIKIDSTKKLKDKKQKEAYK